MRLGYAQHKVGLPGGIPSAHQMISWLSAKRRRQSSLSITDNDSWSASRLRWLATPCATATLTSHSKIRSRFGSSSRSRLALCLRGLAHALVESLRSFDGKKVV